MKPSKIKTFTTIAYLEGISFVVLLAIAMPLKYLLDLPEAVTVVGWAHGILFMLYAVWLVLCWNEYGWSFSRVLMYFIASLLPFVPFVIERRLKSEYAI